MNFKVTPVPPPRRVPLGLMLKLCLGNSKFKVLFLIVAASLFLGLTTIVSKPYSRGKFYFIGIFFSVSLLLLPLLSSIATAGIKQVNFLRYYHYAVAKFLSKKHIRRVKTRKYLIPSIIHQDIWVVIFQYMDYSGQGHEVRIETNGPKIFEEGDVVEVLYHPRKPSQNEFLPTDAVFGMDGKLKDVPLRNALWFLALVIVVLALSTWIFLKIR